jgi:hypothetical protein
LFRHLLHAGSCLEIEFSVRVDTKDDKFKMLFTNIRVIIPASGGGTSMPLTGSVISSPESELGGYTDNRIKEIQETLTKLGDEIVNNLKTPKKADW